VTVVGDEFTSRERVRRLLAGEPLDRVPVNAFASAYAAVVAGVSFRDYYLDPAVALRCQQEAAVRHEWDGTPAYAMPGWGTWDFGGEIAFPDAREGGFPFTSRHVAETPAEVEALTVPDPLTAPATSRTIEFARLAWAAGGAPCITGGSPVFEAVQMVGADRLLRWYRREPATVAHLLGLITDYILRIADVFIGEFGAQNCTVFEAFPTESHAVVSPAVFERFTLPCEVRIHEELLGRGVTTWVILCAATTGATFTSGVTPCHCRRGRCLVSVPRWTCSMSALFLESRASSAATSPRHCCRPAPRKR
jgi:uroporphyrinogen decarboxylase